LGHIISSAIKSYEGDVLIVASSDMNHMESRDVTREKDEKALDRLRSLDVAGFLEVTEKHNITVCGKVAIATMIEAALQFDASVATVVMYRDSGDVTGDLSDVVGYAGIVVR
jgi:AmmeMemoRadiSam system protein B